MNLPNLLSESAREFDEKVAGKRGVLAREGHVLIPILFEEQEVKNLLLSKQRAVIEAVIAEAENATKKKDDGCCCWVSGYNAALQDVVSRLREALDETRV